jgi:oligopeptide transport system substrate-binding protein
MKIIGLLLLLLGSFQSFGSAAPFRFHLVSEPGSLRPWEQKNSVAGYFLSQITGTLLSYQDRKLQGNLAEKCLFQNPTHVRCTLRKNLQWSDSSPLTAGDFVRAFQELSSPQNKAFRADLIFPIKNARKVFQGELPANDLKVQSPTPLILDIFLEKPDPDFLFSLTSPLLAPLPAEKPPTIEELRKKPDLWKSSGPYTLDTWEAQKKIRLKNNPHFWKKTERPPVEILIINEDTVALSLYEKGELGFLRRLPTLFIPKFKGRPDYFEIEQFRFDYLGFSQRWKDNTDLRLALSQSLRYSDLQNLYHAKGLPGCPGIPAHLLSENICHTLKPDQAKQLWSNLKDKPKKLELLYSRQGGDDHKRSMEWFQSEWKTQLGANVEVTGLENKIFTERLEKNPPDIFRKGIAPERPTCLSALEAFETGNTENYIRFSQKEYDQILATLRTTTDESKKKKLCGRALHVLMDLAWIIPTGPIHFTILAQTRWTGWKLNELNQLDLSGLKVKN